MDIDEETKHLLQTMYDDIWFDSIAAYFIAKDDENEEVVSMYTVKEVFERYGIDTTDIRER